MGQSNHIENLRIYQLSRKLEDTLYESIKTLPNNEFYYLGNDLRRSSAAVSHHITEAHRRYSYAVKSELLHLARTEISALQDLLSLYESRGYGDTSELSSSYRSLYQQIWGLITYFKRKQQDRQRGTRIKAADALVAARV